MNKPGLDDGFPSLRPALDGLYATFSGDVGLPKASGEADFDSIMTNALEFQKIERHKRILPRVLELLAEETVDSADYAWVIMNKIAVRWRDWPPDEQIAIQMFML